MLYCSIYFILLHTKPHCVINADSGDCGMQHASERGIAMNYDAEQFNIQPVIDTLVLDSMRRFNRSTAQVLNTYQCYLKVRIDKMHFIIQILCSNHHRNNRHGDVQNTNYTFY